MRMYMPGASTMLINDEIDAIDTESGIAVATMSSGNECPRRWRRRHRRIGERRLGARDPWGSEGS
eukprot:6178313-Pleurochrysis_carterae.AAC.1